MARRRSNKRERRIRSKTSLRKTRKTKRVKSKKRSKKLHGGANAGNLNAGEAEEYIKKLLGMSKLFPDEISVSMISKVRVNEEKTIKDILGNLNKNNDKKVYSVEDLYDETIAYVKSYKQ